MSKNKKIFMCVIIGVLLLSTIAGQVSHTSNMWPPAEATISSTDTAAADQPAVNETAYTDTPAAVNASQPSEAAEDDGIQWLDGFEEVSEADLKDEIKAKTVSTAVVNQTTGVLYMVMEDGAQYKVTGASNQLKAYLRLKGLDIKTVTFTDDDTKEGQAGADTSIASTFAMLTLLFLLLFLIVSICRRQTKSASIVGTGYKGGTKTDEEIPQVKFSDVEGIEELKADIFRLVDCLKNPKKYQDIGARVPKGVILYGPPGTGKTLIAKAIAGEAGVPFFSAVGSDFVEKYVGVGASRVRDLYKKARKAAPCIVFIDEIDAVAGQRGQDNSEKDQTINALLAELDGFRGSGDVITVCATNRLDMLDSAFKRAGRFDLKLAVGLPDRKSRRNILAIHSKGKKLGEEIDLDAIAAKTPGFSGAELEALLNESALVAVGKGRTYIANEDVDDAFFKIVTQSNKKKRESITETNRIVAWHEAGHALASKLLTDDTVSSVTIIGSSSGAGGITFRTPKEDNVLHSRKYLESTVQVMYAGRAAEEIYFGDTDLITTGASQDIRQATQIIREYLALYGMGDRGMIDLSQFEQDYREVVDEASEMSKKLYAATLKLLTDNKDTLSRLAEELLLKETLDESEIDSIIGEEARRKTA